MKIFIASDSYKGCMSSVQANEQIERGIHRADPSVICDCFAISDGGEGFVEAFAAAGGMQIRSMTVSDLYGTRIRVQYAYDPNSRTAAVEAASMLGLTLTPRALRRPMDASSYGLGELCRQILREHEVDRLFIGLGGTGTNDGGMGFLEAFGAKFFDRSRRRIAPCANSLGKVAFIDKREFRVPSRVEMIAACDVVNPYTGAQGATHVFGPQKGLRPAQILLVEKGMRYFAGKIDQTFHVQLEDKPGGGAAGGLGGVLGEVFGAHMVSGIDLLASGRHMKEKMEAADLIITGEGQSDSQSACGKAVGRIGDLAKECGKPLIVISGALGKGYEALYDHGVCALFSTADRAMAFSQALQSGPEKLERAAENIMRLLLAAKRIWK